MASACRSWSSTPLELIRHKFSHDYGLHGGKFYNSYGSVVVALGHVGMLMLIVQSGALDWLTRRLAAVGRMALSNYLTHSIVCTTLFYGYGFGLFGHVNRTGLAAIVFTIWVAQLLISPIWLKYFRYGPAEWLWRSLTYGHPQPMRVRESGEARDPRCRPACNNRLSQTKDMLNSTAVRGQWRRIGKRSDLSRQRRKVTTCQRKRRPSRPNWNRRCWTPSRATSPPSHWTAKPVTGEEPQAAPRAAAGRGGGALLLGRRPARLCAPGHPGDEYRRPSAGRGSRTATRCAAAGSKGSIGSSGTSIICSSK